MTNRAIALCCLVLALFGSLNARGNEGVSSASSPSFYVDTVTVTNSIFKVDGSNLPFRLDYSSSVWYKENDDSSVRITVDGETIFNGTGDGTYWWSPEMAGGYSVGFVAANGTAISKTFKVVAPTVTIEREGFNLCKLTASDGVSEIRYTTDGSIPTAESALYTEPFAVSPTKFSFVRASAFANGYPQGEIAGVALRPVAVAVSEAKVNCTIDNSGTTKMVGYDAILLPYDAEWDGDFNSSVQLLVDGELLAECTGAGEEVWSPEHEGLTTLTLKTLDNAGETLAEYSAQYDVMPRTVVVKDGDAPLNERYPGLCQWITNIIIDASVASIGEGMFAGCEGLTSLAIPDGVLEVGDGAFAGCASLRIVEAEIGLKRLLEKDGVFADCPDDLKIAYHPSPAIHNIVARQRKPWNGKVDIAFELEGNVAEVIYPHVSPILKVSAWDSLSEMSYVAVADALTGDVGSDEGMHHIIWDMDAQGLEFKSDQIVFRVEYETDLLSNDTLNYTLCSADSAAIAIDLRDEPIVDSIVVAWGAAWIGDDAGATVVITDNGEVVTNVTGSGEFEYELADAYKHELTYKTFIGGDEQEEIYTATLFKGWKYTVDDNGGAVILGSAINTVSLVIPSELDGYEVVGFGEDAFNVCESVTELTIGNQAILQGLTCADASICEVFPNVASIKLAEGITTIPANTFTGCSALVAVSIPDSMTSIDRSAFDGCVINSREDGYKVIDGWLIGFSGDAQTIISDIDSIRGVADGALEGCRALEDLTFTQNSVLKTIGKEAFKGCTELRTMTLPPSLEEIGYEAFMGCSYLGNVIVPGNVKRVGDRAFKNCTGFTAAQIEYGVEALGEEVFYGDWRISEVDIPSTVTNIGVNAFGGDSSIIRIGLRGDIRPASDIFSNYENIREATVKSGDGEVVNGLFSGFKDLRSVHFLGNCPRLENDGEWIYYGTPVNSGNESGLITYVEADSTGWDGTPGSHSLPQAWPLYGYYRRAIAWWNVPTYLVQFDSNGGTLGVQDTYQYSERHFNLPPEPVQTGYSFAGWWTQPVGGLRVTADTIFIEGVYTHLYAHWIKGHWVFLDPNGGTVVNDFVTYVEQSVYGVLPTPVRSGYAFGGWFYNGYKIEPETEINEKADHTLVAQWTANLYSVRYNANGGDGDMAEQGFVYGVEQELRKNLYARSGYEFIGWATNAVDAVGLEEETDAVVYADCESVMNLTAVADGWIELFAVWKESDVLPDPTNLDFHSSGDSNWELRYEGATVEKDGKTLRYATVWRSGNIGNNQKSVLVANTYGAGKIGFWWKVSCESFKSWKLDYLEFAIDGTAQEPWINGEKDWTYVEFEVESSGEHTLTWTYSKDEDGVGGEDCGWITAAVWTPKLESFGDYVNSPALEFASSGDAAWHGDENTGHDGIASLRSGAIGDDEVSTLEAEVDGAGRIGFWWKVSSEAYRTFKLDYVSFWIDDVEQDWIGGEIGWTNMAFDVVGSGTHILKWEYRKDAQDSSGDDCAWLDEIVWTPKSVAPVVNIDKDKMEEPVETEVGVKTIEAKDDQPLSQEDADAIVITINMESEPEPVDTTAGYNKTYDPASNTIVITLKEPEVGAAATEQEVAKVEGDATGMLAEVNDENVELATEAPTPTEEEVAAGTTVVSALPVKAVKGLYYQASWGSDLSNMRQGEKVQATGDTLYLGVIKQQATQGFYKVTVSEQ